jgi:hypothetical protein
MFDEGSAATGQPAQWPIMEADEELKSVVRMRRIIWNGNAKAPPLIPLPAEYQGLVTHGPFFWLEAGRDDKGKPVGVVYRGESKVSALKEWIFTTIKTDKLFVHYSAGKKQRQVVTASTNRPTQQLPSKALTQPGAPKVPQTYQQQGGLDRRPRPAAQVVLESADGSDDEPMEARRPPAAQPSPHTAPGGSNTPPQFSYNRPGTQPRLAFNEEVSDE